MTRSENRRALLKSIKQQMPREPGTGWTTAWHSLFAAVGLASYSVIFDASSASGSGYFAVGALLLACVMFAFHRWIVGHYLRDYSNLQPLPVREQVVICGLLVLAIIAPRPRELYLSVYVLPVLAILEWRLWKYAKPCRMRQFHAEARKQLRSTAAAR
jgi:hypothetical protein